MASSGQSVPQEQFRDISSTTNSSTSRNYEDKSRIQPAMISENSNRGISHVSGDARKDGSTSPTTAAQRASGRVRVDYELIRLAKGTCAKCDRPRNPLSKRLCDVHLEWYRLRANPNHRQPNIPRGKAAFSTYSAMAAISTAVEKCRRAGLSNCEIKSFVRQALKGIK
jgi:hypothetical protein